MKARHFEFVGILFVPVLLFGFGYNQLATSQEAVHSAWAQVQTAYQRRFDLVVNLSNIVQAYAKHEKDTFALIAKIRGEKLRPQAEHSGSVSALPKNKIKGNNYE